jgi:hypothetical protein
VIGPSVASSTRQDLAQEDAEEWRRGVERSAALLATLGCCGLIAETAINGNHLSDGIGQAVPPLAVARTSSRRSTQYTDVTLRPPPAGSSPRRPARTTHGVAGAGEP